MTVHGDSLRAMTEPEVDPEHRRESRLLELTSEDRRCLVPGRVKRAHIIPFAGTTTNGAVLGSDGSFARLDDFPQGDFGRRAYQSIAARTSGASLDQSCPNKVTQDLGGVLLRELHLLGDFADLSQFSGLEHPTERNRGSDHVITATRKSNLHGGSPGKTWHSAIY